MLYLVDASVFIFRAYYSTPLEMTDPDGHPVNAVHGFARFLVDLLERRRPDHLAIAFDERVEVSFRSEIYPAYKANREPAPPDLQRQFSLCRELCRAFGVSEFASSRYEADDIIGTISREHRISDGRALHVGCSVGMSVAPDQGRQPEVLLARADAALYSVKSQGKGQTGVWRALGEI